MIVKKVASKKENNINKNKLIIKNLKQKLVIEKTKYLKQLANLENDRKIFIKDKAEFIKFTNQKLLLDLIEVLDTFILAMHVKKPAPEVKKFLFGFKMIEQQFIKLLEKNHVKVISSTIGSEPNNQFHHVLEEIISKEKSGKIAEVVCQGHTFHDRLLRPAMVKISKISKEK